MAPGEGDDPPSEGSKPSVLPLNEPGKTYGVVTVPKTGVVGVNNVVTWPTLDGPEKMVADPVGTASTSYEYWVPPMTEESLYEVVCAAVVAKRVHVFEAVMQTPGHRYIWNWQVVVAVQLDGRDHGTVAETGVAAGRVTD